MSDNMKRRLWPMSERTSRNEFERTPAPPQTEREAQLSIALRSMLSSYDRVLATLPRNTLAHGFVVEAFGLTPQIAAQVLMPKRRGS